MELIVIIAALIGIIVVLKITWAISKLIFKIIISLTFIGIILTLVYFFLLK